MEEDTFRVRVDKIFGKIDAAFASENTTAPLSTAQSPTSSLWRLTDEEIERRKWNRHTELDDEEEEEEDDGGDDEESNLKDPLESDLQDLSDFEEGEQAEDKDEGGKLKRCNTSFADDDWDVQANIGRDSTLDFEEEEDEFDKVAVGKEQQDGDRLYMKDVRIAEYDIDELDTHCELPNSFRAVEKDPRANHMAAKMRLKEDAEASGDLDRSLISANVPSSVAAEDSNREQLNVNLPKPILKKRGKQPDSRPSKRVCFTSETKTESEDQLSSEPSELSSRPSKHNGAVEQCASDLYSPGIPDYLRNPSKYTRYAFNSSDDTDDKSNKNAFMEFFQSLRQSNDHRSQDDTPVDISKPVMFTPRTKQEDQSDKKGGNKTTGESKNSCSVVSSEDIQESEVSAMEEDKKPLAVETGSSIQKPGRQYRARTTSD